MVCVICFEDIKERNVRCSRCSFICHESCWKSLLTHESREEMKYGAKCPICKLWISECPFMVTRSMTYKNRCQEKEREIRYYLISIQYIQEEDLRLKVMNKLFECVLQAPHMQEREHLMSIVRITLRRLFREGWKGAEYYYYRLYAEKIV